MVHTGQVAAAARAGAVSGDPEVMMARRNSMIETPSPRPSRGSLRILSRGSFRAGSPLPTLRRGSVRSIKRQQSAQHHYQTFPTPPPKQPRRRAHDTDSSSDHSTSSDSHRTPLPWKQLALLAVLSLAEQTALNSISPYLPNMVESFPDINTDNTGLYVGLLASAFAMAQLATNLFWGYLSDVIGRKPVMLMGTALLCACFAAFGFCTKYWHAVIVHVAMGLLDGNAAVVPTCLGELTDRSNQSKAFTWLPVVYSLGSITGPALGGLLVGKLAGDRYPFLAPNVLGASLLAFSVVVLWLWFDETLEEKGKSVDTTEYFGWLGCCMKRAKRNLKHKFAASFNGPRDGHHDADERSETRSETRSLLRPSEDEVIDDSEGPLDAETWRRIWKRTTILLLITYLIFQVSNISFGSLYPLFALEPPPTGRGLQSDVVGVSLSVAGVFTILFQLFAFRPIKARLGNLGSYRGSLLGLAISMVLMPWVGYVDSHPPFGFGSSKLWLYVEMGVILVIRNICSVGGLSSVMLLITNSAPSHASLGTLNGVAQTLSALGRSFGPFVSGSLFTLSVRIEPKGELLAWGLFGGIALVGWVASYGIHGEGLESTDDGFEDDEDLSDDTTTA